MDFTERFFQVVITLNDGEVYELETSSSQWWLDRPRKRSLKEEIIVCATIENEFDIPVKPEDCEVFEVVKIKID